MSRSWFVVVVIGGMMSCTKSEDLVVQNETENNSYRQYIIPKGQHYASGNNFAVLDKKSLHFKVRFDSSCVYSLVKTGNAGDINKLYGFSDCGSGHHQNSARFGWVWNGKAIELHAYCYTNGQRSNKLLGAVAIGQEAELRLKAEPGKYVFTIDGKNESMKRNCSSDQDAAYLLFPYFGGDEVAPHDIRIFIKDL